MSLDVATVRQDFPILTREVNGQPLVYLDSAATTQKPRQVIDSMSDFYQSSNASVHRGAYSLAEEATALYEGARARIGQFIDAASPREVVFTRGTTSGINAVAYGWGLNQLKQGDRILLTAMEHHANIVPWQLVARHNGAELVYMPITDEFLVDTSQLEDYIDERVKVIGVSGMSNVLGSMGPLPELTAAAKTIGAITVVDAAQLVPHVPTSVAELGADFVAFGAHKMLGPTGIGALWGRLELLEQMEPAEGDGPPVAILCAIPPGKIPESLLTVTLDALRDRSDGGRRR